MCFVVQTHTKRCEVAVSTFFHFFKSVNLRLGITRINRCCEDVAGNINYFHLAHLIKNLSSAVECREILFVCLVKLLEYFKILVV